MSRALFTIADELKLIENAMGEATDNESNALLNTFFADLTEERDKKLENYARYIADLESQAKQCRTEVQRLEPRAKSLEAVAKKLRARLAVYLKTTGALRTAMYTFFTKKNEPAVLVDKDTDVLTVDERFQNIKRDFSLSAIAQALEAGEEITWARFGEPTVSAVIK